MNRSAMTVLQDSIDLLSLRALLFVCVFVWLLVERGEVKCACGFVC
jgi:hypothetical protein